MFKVYWTNTEGNTLGESFSDMTLALQHTQSLRNNGHKFVCMASEITECVTKLGVDSVVNGLLPDGNDYEWKKRR